MMSKAEVESLSSYNSEVEEKQARHIDNEVSFYDVFVGDNQCEYFDNFHVFVDDDACGNADDNGKLEDDNYVVNKVFKDNQQGRYSRIINMLT